MGLLARMTERIAVATGAADPRGALPVPPVGFTDGTIALRPWRPSDGLDLAALCDDDEIRRFTAVPREYPARDAAGNAAYAEAERLAGRGTHLAIVDKLDSVLLGAVDLTIPGPTRAVGRVSFLLAAAHRGQGHATAAVRLLDGWALGTAGVGRLECLPQADNAAAIAVVERAGFERDEAGVPAPEGRIRLRLRV